MTSPLIKLTKTLFSFVLIVFPLLMSYNILCSTFQDKRWNLQDNTIELKSSREAINFPFSMIDCNNELVINSSFTIIIAILWNYKNALKIGII